NGAIGGTLAQHALLASVLAASWLLLRRRQDRYYAEEIATALDITLVGRRRATVSFEEAGAALALVPLVDGPNEKHVVYAMDRLADLEPDILLERREQLLGHVSPLVRERAAATFTLIGAALPRPSGSSIHTETAQAENGITRRSLAERVEDPDPGIRRAA